MATDCEKSATIYIVRHGETIGNIQRIILHPNDDILSDIGKNQAKLLAASLKDVRFTKVFTSEYPRTKETASIILDGNEHPFPRSEIKVDPRLREIGYKNLHQQPYSYLLKAVIQYLQSENPVDEFQIDDSEPIPEVQKRAKESMMDIFQDSFATPEPDNILIVSHGLCIRMMMKSLNESEEFESTGWNPSGSNIIRNTGYMKLLAKEVNGKVQIHFQHFHAISHLPKEMLETDSLTRLAQTSEGKCLSGCFQV